MASMADKRNLFESPPERAKTLPRVIILEGGKVVWKVAHTRAGDVGWTHLHTCGGKAVQWATPHRPQSVRCPQCGEWVIAP